MNPNRIARAPVSVESRKGLLIGDRFGDGGEDSGTGKTQIVFHAENDMVKDFDAEDSLNDALCELSAALMLFFSHALKRLKAFLAEFGLTPASRTRIAVRPADDSGADEWKDLL